MTAHLISTVRDRGEIRFPGFRGDRFMMMPIDFADARTFPSRWRDLVERLVELSGVDRGVGYLTIDEAVVRAGETHRRPGIHVDGGGAWGGPASPWAKRGMVVAASDVGCVVWPGDFRAEVGEDGACEHLRGLLCEPEPMRAGRAYACSPAALHAAVRLKKTTRRQFVRLSLPNDEPWFEGYTPSPCDVLPAGPILPRRASQMAFRAEARL